MTVVEGVWHTPPVTPAIADVNTPQKRTLRYYHAMCQLAMYTHSATWHATMHDEQYPNRLLDDRLPSHFDTKFAVHVAMCFY